MNEKEKLQQQIAEAKERLEKLEQQEKINGKKDAIKELSEYTDEEKIQFFDKLYNSAYLELTELEEEGYHNEDCAQYAWEEYIAILAKDRNKFWRYWSSLC